MIVCRCNTASFGTVSFVDVLITHSISNFKSFVRNAMYNYVCAERLVQACIYRANDRVLNLHDLNRETLQLKLLLQFRLVFIRAV